MSLQQSSGEECSLCRIHEFSHRSFSHSLTFNEATSELYSGGVGKHTIALSLVAYWLKYWTMDRGFQSH